MHLGYHELRNMLSKFREEREKRKMGPPGSTPSGGAGSVDGGSQSRGNGEHRSRGDDYRDRDRGYERHSSTRYEYEVFAFVYNQLPTDIHTATDEGTGSDPAVLGGEDSKTGQLPHFLCASYCVAYLIVAFSVNVPLSWRSKLADGARSRPLVGVSSVSLLCLLDV